MWVFTTLQDRKKSYNFSVRTSKVSARVQYFPSFFTGNMRQHCHPRSEFFTEIAYQCNLNTIFRVAISFNVHLILSLDFDRNFYLLKDSDRFKQVNFPCFGKKKKSIVKDRKNPFLNFTRSQWFQKCDELKYIFLLFSILGIQLLYNVIVIWDRFSFLI